MNFDSTVRQIAARAKRTPNPNDYIGDNGMLYCGSCNTPRQCRIEIDGEMTVVWCMCDCESKAYAEKQAKKRREEERMRIDALRIGGIAEKGLRDCRFDTARETPLLAQCRRYVDRWEQAERENLGLLFWGEPGGGKTFAAACIANALIDRGIQAMITSFPRLLAASWEERGEFLRNAIRFPLLVIDDFGVERNTEFSAEAVYIVIDEWYKNKRPLIITTNLPLQAIQNPQKTEYQRIYDRILEMCAPVFVEAATFRKDGARRKFRSMKEIFGGKETG